jgi:Flp pilus assembly protein TadD
MTAPKSTTPASTTPAPTASTGPTPTSTTAASVPPAQVQSASMPPAGVGNDAIAAAIARYQAGAFREAAALFADLRVAAPEDPTLLRLQGLALVRAGDPASGVPLLARARQLAPDDPLSTLHLGIGRHAAGALTEAAQLFRACIALMPGRAAPFVNLAIVRLDQGDARAAARAARAAVAAEPSSADARLALARALAARGDRNGAVAAYEACLRLRPNDADAWVSYGAALYRFGAMGQATTALDRALTIVPDHPLAHANLAALEGLRGEPAAAIARLRSVLDRQPDCGPARLNLANLLIHERDAAEALKLLPDPPPPRQAAHWLAQRAAALLMLGRRDEARSDVAAAAPPFGDAEILLTWLRIALDDGTDETSAAERDRLAGRLAVLADADGAGLPEHRIIAHFDLATLHAREDRRAVSFSHWRKGHEVLARLQPFSRETHADFIRATRTAFDATRLSSDPRADNIDPAPVFIVGMPRSGTSLTEQILAAHPLVHGAGERLEVHGLLMRLAGGVLTRATVERLAALDAASLSNAARTFLAELHGLAPEARFITDKMPGNGLYLGFLATLLPGARVIRCTRDPRDIGLSIFQRRFFGYHPYAHDLADLGWYIGQHEALMRHWEAVLPLLTIALTDWIDDFDTTLARLLDFLGLPPDPACARFYELDRRVSTASRDQVSRPINRAGIDRWRDYETELQPLIAELTAAGLLAPPPEQPCHDR